MSAKAQRKTDREAAYAGSSLQKRNAALAVAATLDAAHQGTAGIEPYLLLPRVTTVGELVAGADRCGNQVDAHGREPFLLVKDEFNPDEYQTIPIHDHHPDAERRSGLCYVVLEAGEALVRPDTLVYWQ